MRPNKEAIRGLDINVVLVGVIVAPDLEAIVFRVGTLFINHIILRVSLIYPFMKCSRLLMEVGLVSMTA